MEPPSAEIYVGGPKDSVVTEHRAANRRRTELVRVSEPPSGDGALRKGSVTRTTDAHRLNRTTRSALCDWPLLWAVKSYTPSFAVVLKVWEFCRRLMKEGTYRKLQRKDSRIHIYNPTPISPFI